MPRITGRLGLRARARWALISASGISWRSRPSLIGSSFWISWEVRKPSKQCRKGRRLRRLARLAMAAQSAASCGEAEKRMAQPVPRVAITSLWSPKIDKPWAARERAATCSTAGVSSPASL